jgi:hypothetical protein
MIYTEPGTPWCCTSPPVTKRVRKGVIVYYSTYSMYIISNIFYITLYIQGPIDYYCSLHTCGAMIHWYFLIYMYSRIHLKYKVFPTEVESLLAKRYKCMYRVFCLLLYGPLWAYLSTRHVAGLDITVVSWLPPAHQWHCHQHEVLLCNNKLTVRTLLFSWSIKLFLFVCYTHVAARKPAY